MKNLRLLFIIAILGIISGIISIYVYKARVKTLPPISVNPNPYLNGIYASGIIESNQKSGSNINIYPEVSGKVTKVFVIDGQEIKENDPLLAIDDTVLKATVAKNEAQAKAALTTLEQLKSEPRPENLAVTKAELKYAEAHLKNAEDQLAKIKQAYNLNPKAISKNTLDNATNAKKIAIESLKVAAARHALVRAGSWSYVIKNQENLYLAANEAYKADKALLEKYIIRAPIAGIVLNTAAAEGSYVSPQGTYDTYTQGMRPVATLAVTGPYLAVRCYVDEILLPKLPSKNAIEASMFIRGEDKKNGIPLEFVRIQPYTIPNIELSSQKAQRVDVRVLPIIFKFKKSDNINLYPGQLVDVFIKGKDRS